MTAEGKLWFWEHKKRCGNFLKYLSVTHFTWCCAGSEGSKFMASNSSPSLSWTISAENTNKWKSQKLYTISLHYNIKGPWISHSTVTSLWGLAWCHTLICCTFASSCLHLYDAPFASFSICKTHMHVSWITPHTYILYCIAPPWGLFCHTWILKYENTKNIKNTKLRLNKRKIHLMNYELKICLKILFSKPLRLFVSLMNLGKELKILAPWKAKALCPLLSLH